MSFASAADHQASSAQNKLFMSKIYTQSHFVHMLQTSPTPQANFQAPNFIPGRFDIYSLVIEVYL